MDKSKETKRYTLLSYFLTDSHNWTSPGVNVFSRTKPKEQSFTFNTNRISPEKGTFINCVLRRQCSYTNKTAVNFKTKFIAISNPNVFIITLHASETVRSSGHDY